MSLIPVQVRLTPEEMDWARRVGIRRQNESVGWGLQDKYGAEKEDGYRIHVLGASGEIAVAAAMRYKHGLPQDVFRGKDYGPLQVRTRAQDWHDLILHEADADDDVFIAVYGTPPDMVIRGWCYGREGKLHEFMQDPGGRRAAYFVPGDVLKQFPYTPDEDRTGIPAEGQVHSGGTL